MVDAEGLRGSGIVRYRLVTDDDCHHFIIPNDHYHEWQAYVDDPEAYGWNPPEWAEELGHDPSFVSFENWQREL